MICYDDILLNKEATEPLHMQLSRILKRKMRALPSDFDGNLMSERKLAEVLGVARVTTHLILPYDVEKISN